MTLFDFAPTASVSLAASLLPGGPAHPGLLPPAVAVTMVMVLSVL